MFNKKKIIIKSVIFCLIITAMVASSYIRQSDMKEKYGITYEISDMGEPMLLDGYQITIEEASLWNVDDYLNHLGPNYMSYDFLFEFYQDNIQLDVSVLEVKINVLKLENSTVEHGVYDLALQMENAYTAYDPYLTAELSKCDTKFDLEIGESQAYIVPYSVIENHFSKEQWDNRDEIQYMLVSSVYPVERAINISNITNCMDNYVPIEYDETLLDESGPSNYAELMMESGDMYDGKNEVYAYGTETMTAGDFEVTLKELRYIHNIDELYEVMEEDGLSFMVEDNIDCFDTSTGEVLPERNLGFMAATVEIKNIYDETRTFNIMQCGLSVDKMKYYSEAIYSSEYNEKGDEHTRLMLNVKPGETISFTTIMVVYGYDCYERSVWYYGFDYLGRGTSSYFIEWDMTKDGGEM